MLDGINGVSVAVAVAVIVGVSVGVEVRVTVGVLVGVGVTVAVTVLVRHRLEPPARESHDELMNSVQPLLHVDGAIGWPQEFVLGHWQH
jgi:hypothetical protein